jgi:hypothetical protein
MGRERLPPGLRALDDAEYLDVRITRCLSMLIFQPIH